MGTGDLVVPFRENSLSLWELESNVCGHFAAMHNFSTCIDGRTKKNQGSVTDSLLLLFGLLISAGGKITITGVSTTRFMILPCVAGGGNGS